MKYPRTFHVPFSPGGTNDDKRIIDCSNFIGKKIVISEKLDGSNCCLKKEGVFARSHNKIATHPSFDYMKQLHSQIKYKLTDNAETFGEYCYAVHSITYKELPSYFFMFGVLINQKTWASYDDVLLIADDLGLAVAPELFRGVFNSEKELQNKIEELCSQTSIFGGEREGCVIRIEDEFPNEDFSKNVAKWVRKDHVQTDEHWMFKSITKQNLKGR